MRRGLLLMAGFGLLLGACSEKSNLVPNQPPQTFLVVEGGGLAPTHYRQILSWHGEDSDGEVARYEYKWDLDPATGASGFDTTWVGTAGPYVTATRDTFFLPVPTTGADTLTHRFRIRAVDAQGLADPVPAMVELPVFNRAPRLWQVSAAGDTSSVLNLPANILPVLTLRFKVRDPDNAATDPEEALAYIEAIRFWFEDPDQVVSVPGTDTLLTLLPEDFGDQVGMAREFHLQAVDRGGAVSNVLTDTAFVRDIRQARILLLDSAVQQTGYNVAYVDPFWRTQFAALFQPGELLIHDLGADGPIGAAGNLHFIFSIFEAVIWYNGNDGAPVLFENSPTPAITAAEPGLRSYLESGGKVLLCGFNMIGASRGPVSGGSLSASFETEVLMLDSLYIHNTNTPGGVETSNFWVVPPKVMPGFAQAGTDTLGVALLLKGVDRMALNSDGVEAGLIEELYRLRGNDTYPSSLRTGATGIRRRFDSGGELVLLSFPISLTQGNGNALEQVAGFLQEFGVLR